MKKLLQILAIILLPFVYFTVMGSITGEEETSRSNTSSYKPTGVQSYLPSFKDEFVNIIFNKGYTYDSIFITHRLDEIQDVLHFNGAQTYFYQDDFYGNILGNTLTGDQITRMNSLMNTVHSSGLKGIYNRNKIADAILESQRVIYEVSSGGSTTENYGFCWQDVNASVGSYMLDSGRNVLKCSTGVNSAGVLCDNIYENLQHSDKLGEWGWSDTRYMWHLKPVMRIDTAVFNPLDQTPVVKIVLKNFKGDFMDSIIIRIQNFANDTGHYGGEYKLQYIFDPLSGDSLNFSADTIDGLNEGWEDVMNSNNMIDKTCAVDFEIYWYGLVDVWFDQLIVDNERADVLFNGGFDDYIEEEVTEFWYDKNYFFFTDELHPSNVSSAKYVFDLAKSVPGAGDVRMSYALTNYFNERGVRREYPLSFKMMFDSVDSEVFTLDVHEVNSWNLLPNSLTGHPSPYYPHPDWFVAYNYYNDYLQKKVFGDKSEDTGRTPESSWSTNTQGDLPAPRGSLIYQVRKARDMSDSIAPNTKMIVQPQIHSGVFRNLTSNTYDKLSHQREPTNQEIEAQAVIALSHGADGLCWFIYDSFSIDFSTGGLASGERIYGDDAVPAPNQIGYHIGLADTASNQLRTYNDYGQNKISYVDSLNQKLLNWKVYLDRIDWYDGLSVHKETANRYFISDIVSIAPYINGVNSCEEDGPYTFTDCDEEKFWEFGFFAPKEPGDFTEYLTVVNRRCEPEYMDGSTPKGDVRVLKIKFNGANLAGFTNWKLTDVYTQQSVTFNKNYTGAIDLGSTAGSLGWFKPGEGKLFMLSPVMQTGGTLVADEVMDDDVIVGDTIFTDGFNLTIEEGTSLEFDTNGVIVAEGGNFICGDISGSSVNLTGTSEWNGITLIDCDTVKIYKTNIEDIKDSAYAVDMYNCDEIEMQYNTFTIDNCGAVRGSYTTTSMNPLIVLYENTFDISGNNIPILNFGASSSSSVPIIVDNCWFYAPTSSSSSAINITNISGAAIKNCEITDYYSPVITLSSSIDLYNNEITTSTVYCSIYGSSGSNLNMTPGIYTLNAGYNGIINSDDDAHNVYVDGSYFIVDGGNNAFDISDSYDGGKHFTGYFPGSSESPYPIDYNCYTYGSSKTDPVTDVTWGDQGPAVSFTYGNDCSEGEGAGYSSKTENNYLVIPLTDHYSDTIEIRSGTGTPTASDSMNIKMRERDYSAVTNIAQRILENLPETPEAHDAISKLYLASLRLDSAGSKMAPLKTFLEEVILDNGENEGLVKRAFYFIQKCKAALGDYQSALAGFEDIINNNPNTYEALVASWDYSATSLLMNSGTGGAGREPDGNEQLFIFNSFNDDPNERNKLTKDEKQKIRTNITKTFEETRKEEINKINKLKEKSDKGDRNAKRELKRREILQVTIEKRQPDNIRQHINAVSSDIQKVFNSTEDNIIKKEINPIPQDYELSQNFPNPFNPTTKIRYALPKEGKVQIVIFDILGREVAKLVNNEFNEAGRYVKEFDGSRLASGIYFYRILVNDGKDFTQVKKMVLVK